MQNSTLNSKHTPSDAVEIRGYLMDVMSFPYSYMRRNLPL